MSNSLQKISRRTCAKTEFKVKWPFKVTEGHVCCSQWKGKEGLSDTI